jgi:hypothetical protein
MRTYTDRLEVTKITKARMMQARLKKGSSTPWEEEESWRLLMESLVLDGKLTPYKGPVGRLRHFRLTSLPGRSKPNKGISR